LSRDYGFYREYEGIGKKGFLAVKSFSVMLGYFLATTSRIGILPDISLRIPIYYTRFESIFQQNVFLYSGYLR